MRSDGECEGLALRMARADETEQLDMLLQMT